VGLAVGAGVVAIPGSTLPVQAVVCSSTLCAGVSGWNSPPPHSVEEHTTA